MSSSFNVILSRAALDDLDDIFDYIVADNPAAALLNDAKIRSFIQTTLSANPHLGRPGRVPGTRELVISGTPYIAPYRVRNEILEILRVYHAARQWPPAS